MAPPPPAPSTFEALVLLGERRAILTDRVRDLLRAQGRQPPPVTAPVAQVGDVAAARRVARAALDELEREYAVPLALWEDNPAVDVVADHGDVWVVSWNSVEYLRTLEFSRQVLAGPIAVPKDGSGWLVLGTALPLEEELREWRVATGRVSD
nr:YrhB domain-containing protein [Ornithinimicrobium sp. F0845]